MKTSMRLVVDFFLGILKEWILWIFIGLDGIGFLLQYAPLVSSRFKSISMPTSVYIGLPIIGFIWASFRVYLSARSLDDPKIRNMEKDREFFDEMVGVLPSTGSIRTLRDYDFGSAFDLEWIRDIHEFEEKCLHPEFEFIDPELEHLKVDLLSRCEEFTRLIGRETYPLQMPNRLLNRIPQEMSYQDPERYKLIRGSINESADKIVEAYDILIRRARRKL